MAVILPSVMALFELFLIFGMKDIIKDLIRKQYVIVANYKSDLEMTLLAMHQFDEFIKTTEAAMKGEDEISAKHSGIG